MSYQPDLYDVVTSASLQGDVEWYRDRARESGGPVLELGAGTGRVTVPIARAGISIHALDVNDAMLARLRAKIDRLPPEDRERIRVVSADMRTFDLPQRFPLIICPFRAFLHNLTETDQLACLERVREHLTPDGRFAFNIFHPSLTYMAQNTGPLAGVWRWRGTYNQPSGGWVVLSEAVRYDTVMQRLYGLHRYEEYGPVGMLERTAMFRVELAYLYPSDVRGLLAAAGFRDVTINGGFDGREFSRDGEELVITAA